jgi:hypothetical protein
VRTDKSGARSGRVLQGRAKRVKKDNKKNDNKNDNKKSDNKNDKSPSIISPHPKPLQRFASLTAASLRSPRSPLFHPFWAKPVDYVGIILLIGSFAFLLRLVASSFLVKTSVYRDRVEVEYYGGEIQAVPLGAILDEDDSVKKVGVAGGGEGAGVVDSFFAESTLAPTPNPFSGSLRSPRSLCSPPARMG